MKTTYYLRSLGASQVEKSSINAAGTQLRKKNDAGAEGEVTPAVAEVQAPIVSPLATPSPIQKEQIDAAKVAQVVEQTRKPEIRLHVAEEAVCEACQ